MLTYHIVIDLHKELTIWLVSPNCMIRMQDWVGNE